jgi:Uncharacterized protein conserved in bacteria
MAFVRSPRRGLLSAFLALLSFSGLAAASTVNAEYSVLVSIADQKTYVYHEGSILRSMTCSTGILDGDNDTPLGDFIIDESGTKRGTWFYSEKYREGAKYWVGFIGGAYLFHSVPMDKNGLAIEAEAAKLGSPASHGCVRLSVDDAHWFYSAIPSGTRLRIIAASATPMRSTSMTKAGVAGYLASHFATFKQKHALSCEIAMIRTSLSLFGIAASEDEILATIPRAGQDPERAFVCDDVDGGRRLNGIILWDNYGTHPPIVVAEIERRLAESGLSSEYEASERRATNTELRSLIASNPRFLGAIIWLVGHPERWGDTPPVNERGMVLGEHVRFLEPSLSPSGEFRIWDPETGKLMISSSSGTGRELFHYRVVALFAKG